MTMENNMKTLSIIRTRGDGRCFFRGICALNSPQLRTTARNENGTIHSPILQLQEDVLSDQLRASMVNHMLNNINDYIDLDNAVLNADMPTNLHCDSITDRLTLVSKHDSSVGELEIQATANMLRKTIIVVNEQFDNINVYNDLYNRHIDNCITLRFLQLGEYVGHYEAILPDDACRVSVNKCTKPHDIIPVPRKSKMYNKRYKNLISIHTCRHT